MEGGRGNVVSTGGRSSSDSQFQSAVVAWVGGWVCGWICVWYSTREDDFILYCYWGGEGTERKEMCVSQLSFWVPKVQGYVGCVCVCACVCVDIYVDICGYAWMVGGDHWTSGKGITIAYG